MSIMRFATTAALALTLASAPALAQSKQAGSKGKAPAKPATAPAAAPANPPQITVIGVRVIGTGLGANGTELRPFNEAPGTTLALGVLAPKGSGIVEIDNRGSTLTAFGDDKGQSLMEEARVGSFPHITEDGAAAIVELEVRARPSSGTASVTAQGALAITLAGGSKPFRSPSVKLENGQTFKVGTATITLSDVKAEDESSRFTLNLTRALYTTIRGIKFFDAKGGAVDMERHSSGYFNDKAELELEAKTKDKVIAIELDVWQNLKTSKFPFNVQAGLGVGGGRDAGTSDAAAPKSEPAPKAEPKTAEPEGPPPAIGASDGAASVEAVVKQMQTAALAGKGAQVLSVIYPTERDDYAQGVAMALAFLPMAFMNDEKAADAMTKELDVFFDKHKVKPPFSRDAADLFKGVDLNAFVSDSFTFIKSHAKKGDKPADMLPVPSGSPENVKVSGDTAVATLGGKDVNFSKISGRWFIRLK